MCSTCEWENFEAFCFLWSLQRSLAKFQRISSNLSQVRTKKIIYQPIPCLENSHYAITICLMKNFPIFFDYNYHVTHFNSPIYCIPVKDLHTGNLVCHEFCLMWIFRDGNFQYFEQQQITEQTRETSVFFTVVPKVLHPLKKSHATDSPR